MGLAHRDDRRVGRGLCIWSGRSCAALPSVELWGRGPASPSRAPGSSGDSMRLDYDKTVIIRAEARVDLGQSDLRSGWAPRRLGRGQAGRSNDWSRGLRLGRQGPLAQLNSCRPDRDSPGVRPLLLVMLTCRATLKPWELTMKLRASLLVLLLGLFPGSSPARGGDAPQDAEKDTFWVIPHTHWEGAVFKTRERVPRDGTTQHPQDDAASERAA